MLKEYCSQAQQVLQWPFSKNIRNIETFLAMLGTEITSKSTSAWVWQGMAYVSKENIFQE